MNILVERQDRVVVVKLNRPRALNALNSEMMGEIVEALRPLDRSAEVGCFVITGSEKVFAAGADIKEMAQKSYLDMVYEDFFAGWEAFAALRTPKIAAVAECALGGGCELAMMCDLIYAADNAQFGQPEIKLGVIPGMGGSQRLTKLVGKAKAMDMILTGRTMDADEAERSGLVAGDPSGTVDRRDAGRSAHHRRLRQARGDGRPRSRGPRWSCLCARDFVRAAHLPRSLRHPGSTGRHECVCGEARRCVCRAVGDARIRCRTGNE
ncbi:MAG: enoyl-CoA hydratase-related protein [Caldilineaceae bacterium]